MGQSRPYGFGKNETQINYSVNKGMGGSNYGFPTGSTFKPFVAAAAIEQGKPPTQVYPSPYQMPYPSSVSTCSGKPWVNQGDTVENENESEVGPYDLKDAMAMSVNTYFVQMIGEIGMCPVVEMTDKLDVVMGNDEKLPERPSSLTLGSNGISPLNMASAYAAFANRGKYCTPTAIESISTADGKSLAVPKTNCSKAMSERTADTINNLLRGVIDSGTGQSAGLSSRDNAGKTGTTDGRKNAWFVGYTPNLSGAVWVGSPSQDVEMEYITIGGEYHDKVFGGKVPGPIWKDAMTGALDGREAPNFVKIHIPDAPKEPADKNKPGGDNKPGGGTGGGTGDGGGGGTGGGGGDDDEPRDPWDGITIPPDLIGGGNQRGGQGNGGWR
jgi:membrane peptidoglycan carboxypeptidase